MGSSWMVFLGGSALSKNHFCQQVRGASLHAWPCLYPFCFRLIAAARFALLRTGEAPLSATGFGVDFLPPFWGHLKQPVLLQGSWRRLGFFKMDC